MLNKNNIFLDFIVTSSNICSVSLNNLPIVNVGLHRPSLIVNYSSPFHYINNLVGIKQIIKK